MTVIDPPRVVAQAPCAFVRWEIVQGVDWRDSFQLRELGDVLPLSGARLEMVITPAADRGPEIARLSTMAGSIEIANAALGLVNMNVPAGLVATYPAGSWFHVLRLLTSDGARAVSRGPFLIHPAR